MTGIRTRDEALAAVYRGLSTWDAEASGVLTQATAVVGAARVEADGAVRRWTGRVAAVEALLAAVGPEDDPRPLQAELARSEASLQAARSARSQVENAAVRVEAMARRAAQSGSAQIAAARADLTRRGADLADYQAAGTGSGVPSGARAASAAGRSDGPASGALAALGMSDLDPGALDYSDNPILGDFGRGGASRADYRWAVQTWDEVVGPGVARGMTRDDFAARDQARSAPAMRRTADVYDMFLGTDHIRVSRGPDGRLTVNGGRHRIAVARELGIRSLPGQVFG